MDMFLLKNFSALRRPAFSLLAGGLLALTAASADAQVSKSGTGYLMRVKYVKGQTLKYKSVTKMVAPGQSQGAMEVGMPRANFPLIALAVGGVVVGVACLASWLPARQAARVDPVVALRAQ